MWDAPFETILRRYLPFFSPDEGLAAETSLTDLGLDSLGKVELLGELESAYDVRFRDEALNAETFENPGSLWTALDAMRTPAV
ncbi:acyl carrier protein [Streptomyces sp. yr375]|nr:phosphopantetheine-binding protein [Streptomyces sp. yr375]SER47319.1 acyl carrier protein [Streptomyces sp. yr375]